jgi:tetratricopeptide (TPR) repeat protein
MKKLILNTSIVLAMQYCFAQSNNPDSLVNILNHLKKDDTAKLALMNQIAVAYTNSDFAKGSQMADRAIALALQLHNKIGLADAFCSKGLNQRSIGNIKEALDTFQKAFDIYTLLNYKPGIAKTLNLIGYAHFQMSHPDKGLPFQLLALKLADSLGDQILIGNININIGSIYGALNDIPQAVEYYQKALTAYEQAKYKKGIARVNGNIGNIYISTNDDPIKGIEYVKKAYSIFKEIGDKRGMSINIHNMGVAYKEIGSVNKSLPDYEKAVECLQQSLEIDKEIGSKINIANNIDNLGQVYNELKDYDKAIPDSKQALLFSESQNITIGITRNLTFLSNSILLAPSDVLKKNEVDPAKRYAIALAYQHRAISLSKQTRDFAEQAEEWKNLSLIYEKQKRFDSALYAYKKYYEANDSFFNIEKSKALTRKTMQYDFDKKEALLKSEQDKKQALAAAEISRQKVVRNAVAAGAGILLLAAITSFIFYKRRRDARAKQKEAELKTEISETEMKALRAQMNPHFIFNSLNSISDYISKNNLSAANNYLTKFAKLMRSILENSEQKEVSLADDLKALELYMQLESLRLNNKFTYQIKVDDNIDKENTQIPPLILQPFVENSIWHGIAGKEGNGKILITIKKEGEMVNCIVEDDGIGIQNSAITTTEKKSFGMKITRSRIDIINKTKKTNASVKLSGLQQGTRAEVKLPLQLSF